MFISIRDNVQSVDEVRQQVEQEFVPTLKQNPQNPGFQGYYLIDCGCPDSGNIVTAISIFDNLGLRAGLKRRGQKLHKKNGSPT
jgi:hypothetical protein